jgi:ribosomal protein S1
MKLRLMDLVTDPSSDLKGQVVKIRHDEVTVDFVTGVRLIVPIYKIIWNKNHWRIND